MPIHIFFVAGCVVFGYLTFRIVPLSLNEIVDLSCDCRSTICHGVDVKLMDLLLRQVPDKQIDQEKDFCLF